MASRDPSRPNVLFILSDDQGAWALGCAGNSEIQTPNLDRLARTGTRMERFFCTSPVCSPARASLLTGMIPSQHGVHDWIREGNWGDNTTEYLAGLPAYTETLARRGYNCGISGKWHMGDSATPQKSFSHWYVHQSGGGPYYGAPMIRDGKLIHEPGYVTDAITDDALAFLSAQGGDDSPFHLWVTYTAPHSPWIGQHPEAFVQQYKDCPFDTCPREPEHPWSRRKSVPLETWESPVESLRGYFAAVTAMDKQIGRLLDHLESVGLREHTFIAFLSDNGYNCGHHGIWGKGNGTFPLNMYDTSVLVPAIFSHPGRVQQGSVSEALVSGYDWAPTVLDYVGLGSEADAALPGRSFAPVLEGRPAEGREQVVVYDEYGPVRMVRTAEWKYVHRYPYGPHELYDLLNDPSERHNVVEDTATGGIVEEMKARLEDWFVQYTDPARDGVHEPVTGRGQLRLAGPSGKGKLAFNQEGLRE